MSLVSLRNRLPSIDFINSLDGHCRLQRLLELCSRSFIALDSVKALHGLTVTMGRQPDQPCYYNNNLIKLYASVNGLSFASTIFGNMSERNVVSYNSMIGAFCRARDIDKSWDLFNEMRRNFDLKPTQSTFSTLFSCDCFDISRGRLLHSLVWKNGLIHADAFVGTALLGLFGRNGSLDEAFSVFEEIPWKSLVTWNSMISLFGHQGFLEASVFLFRDLLREQIGFSEASFVAVLSGLSSERDLEVGKQVHCQAAKQGLGYQVPLGNSFINMYVKCSDFLSAEKMFEEMKIKDVVSWNTIIRALAKSENPSIALICFLDMYAVNISPNQTTYASVINCCTCLQNPIYGQLIHAKAVKRNFVSDVYVGSALVDFYVKCDRLEDASHSFSEIHEKNVVSWNSLISGYSGGSSANSICLLKEMSQLGFRPNEFSLSAVLKSSSMLELQQFHSAIIKMGYHENEYVLSSLIISYARNGMLNDAISLDRTCNTAPLSVVSSNVIATVYNRAGEYHKTQELFAQLEEPDAISWNILIAACARNGDYEEAFELFRHMRVGEVYPDNYTFVSLLSVCATICNLASGSAIHGHIIKTDFESYDTFVCNVLSDTYGKCGSVRSSVKVFDETRDKNLISWTVLISSLGLNGYALEALRRFTEMESQGFKPDTVAFTVILSACRHGGLVKEGMHLFQKMESGHGIKPHMDHYNCMVDLLARSGYLEEAEQVIASMPFPPNVTVAKFPRGFQDKKQTRRIHRIYRSKGMISLDVHLRPPQNRGQEYSR